MFARIIIGRYNNIKIIIIFKQNIDGFNFVNYNKITYNSYRVVPISACIYVTLNII